MFLRRKAAAFRELAKGLPWLFLEPLLRDPYA